MPAEWRLMPEATETLPNGTRVEWACRKVAPTVSQLAPDDVEPDRPDRPRHRIAADPVDGALTRAQRGGAKRMAGMIDAAEGDRKRGVWSVQAIFLTVVLIGMFAWGVYREYRDTLPTNSVAAPNKQNRSVDGGANAVGGGTNNCRALLEKWRRADQRFNWTDDDAGDVDTAIRADGGRP